LDPVTFGISLECLCLDFRDNVRRVRDLEEAGFDYIWEGDHTLPLQHSSGTATAIVKRYR
jgi:alkanesulfonate monooxygenase SsuD/methylene tetrahydromethanopterin reductase-like flavin-dependent oxidoreductase (luciferase family)